MSIAEKLQIIAENERRVYETGIRAGKMQNVEYAEAYADGYEKGYAEGYADALKPATINFAEKIDNAHISSDKVAGDVDNFWWECDGYSVHYFEFSKTVTGGQIGITGRFDSTFENPANECILVVCDGVVAISQSELNVTPTDTYNNFSFTITLPDNVPVNGIYLNTSMYYQDIEFTLTYIE